MNNKFFEWAGVITAILYSLFVALNIGIEFFGFCLLLLSAILIVSLLHICCCTSTYQLANNEIRGRAERAQFF